VGSSHRSLGDRSVGWISCMGVGMRGSRGAGYWDGHGFGGVGLRESEAESPGRSMDLRADGHVRRVSARYE
jgi:hypothetical protein